MKKKLLTLAMAAVMVVSSAVTAFAADETTLDGSEGWWTAHTKGYLVDEDGVELTFKATTDADALNGWDGPVALLYTATEAYAGEYTPDADSTVQVNNLAGYSEIILVRGDSAAFLGANNTWGTLSEDWTWEATKTTDDWEAYKTAIKAGLDCSVVVTKADGAVTLVLKVGDITESKITVKTDTTKDIYLAMTAENCKLTNIKEVVKETTTQAPATETTTVAAGGNNNNNNSTGSTGSGDTAPVLALLAVAAVAGAVVVLRKKEVTE